MSSEDDEVFNSKDIFTVFDIFFFDAHEDVDLVESEMHLLSSCPYYFHRN